MSEEWKKFKFESFETLFEKKKQKEEKNSQIVSKETKEMKNSKDILKNINVVFGEVGSIDKTKNKINSGRFKYDKTYEAVHKKLGFIDDYAKVLEDMWVLYVIDSKTNKKYRVHESYVRFDVVKIDNEKGHIFIEFEYGFNPNKIWCLDIFTSKVIDYNAKN